MRQTGDQAGLTALIKKAVEAYKAQDFDRYERYFVPDLRFCHHNRRFAFDERVPLIETLRMFAADLIPDRRLGPATRLLQAGNVVSGSSSGRHGRRRRPRDGGPG
jgi:hypothetical protein